MTKIVDILASGPSYSFEFFPPKTPAAEQTLEQTLRDLEPLQPSFVSVTYGAGGSTRERTHDIVVHINNDSSLTAMAHLTCAAHTRAELEEIVTRYRDASIENLLALGGDPPKDLELPPGELEHAIDLVRLVRGVGDFAVGVADLGVCSTVTKRRLPAAPGCARVADQAPRYEQRGQEQPAQTPPAVGRINQQHGSDREAGQRRDRRRCHAPGRRPLPGAGGGGGRGPGCGPGGGKIGHKLPELTPGPRDQRPPGSLVEFPGRQPARLEVHAQVRHDRITVGIGRPHRSGKIIPSHGIHRVLVLLSRAVVSGFPRISNVVDRGLPAPLPDDTSCRCLGPV